MRTTQCAGLRNLLQGGQTITQGEAQKLFGIGRLAARIGDLKKQGMDIESEMITVKNRDGQPCRVARYSLAAPTHEGNQSVFRGIML